VDCITMEPIGEHIGNWKWTYPVIPLIQVAAK
jgi:hypothetical protein